MIRTLAVSLVTAFAALSCANVLGIEDAKLDPRLENRDSGTQHMATLCDRYCDAVMANCTDANRLYTTRDVCLDICSTLPKGTEGDTEGNSVTCRLRNAELAASTGETAAHCSIAGPGGNGICGSNCDGYCAEVTKICEGEFISLTDCQTACSTLPDLGHFDVSIQSGGTIQCRLYHVSAATQDPMFHCPHAGGAPPCAAEMTDAAAHD